ncbi:MAG TPA: sugar phosphate isomerase/epimerase [Solirubrobacteraceae bacterium]
MIDARTTRLATASGAGTCEGRQELSHRLGLNVPARWWPTASMLKGIEAAGFVWVQVHTPPRSVLCARDLAREHARALLAALGSCGLRVAVHGPDDLSAGDPAHDRALDGLLDYAEAVGAELIAYHGANFPVVDGGAAAARTHERLAREEDSLSARAARLNRAGIVLAIENLAPVWPGPPRLSHSPRAILDLVRRLASPAFGMLLDLGHAHITGGVASAAELAGDAVCLFHAHDNFGSRDPGAGHAGPGLDPLRLDLHLAPGGGNLPWQALAPQLHDHAAPVLLEVHPPHRPEPLSLVTVTAELLRCGRSPAATAERAPGAAERPIGVLPPV